MSGYKDILKHGWHPEKEGTTLKGQVRDRQSSEFLVSGLPNWANCSTGASIRRTDASSKAMASGHNGPLYSALASSAHEERRR
ncbi:hypothetical protein MMYC01_208481 [Madurella mycetomatis]|uniref:Uncharacterized protein n=1 Tax=Madurella mycetomatis TaxID=100816 RepID=A0A175VS64_9PEZI|nr:hypothetical protein MMYC01_208481 [Madurella mycetomatis]